MIKNKLKILLPLFLLSLASPLYAKIILYSAPWCGFCVKMEQYLDSKKIRYVKIDIDKVRTAKQELIAKTGRVAIPVLDWNGELITGFDDYVKKEIDRLASGAAPIKGKFIPVIIVESNQPPPKLPTMTLNDRFVAIKNIAETLQISAVDSCSVNIVNKFYDAQIAKLAYEHCFTPAFQIQCKKLLMPDRPDDLIITCQHLSAYWYGQAIKEFRAARAKNTRASVTVQNALKAAIQSETTDPNANLQAEYLKIWSCAAIDQVSGNRLQPDTSPGLTSRTDDTFRKAEELLKKIVCDMQNPSSPQDPNIITASD